MSITSSFARREQLHLGGRSASFHKDLPRREELMIVDLSSIECFLVKLKELVSLHGNIDIDVEVLPLFRKDGVEVSHGDVVLLRKDFELLQEQINVESTLSIDFFRKRVIAKPLLHPG